MKNIAPHITRQRLLIEGTYERQIDENEVVDYLLGIADHLGLRTYGAPLVHAPGDSGKDENQGFDAFLPLIDSGISLYVWSQSRFFAVVLFTCKEFDAEAAINFTSKYFQVSNIVSKGF